MSQTLSSCLSGAQETGGQAERPKRVSVSDSILALTCEFLLSSSNLQVGVLAKTRAKGLHCLPCVPLSVVLIW